MDIVNLNVTLNGDHLEVDDAGGKNHIGHGHKAEIHWHLILQGGSGSFDAHKFFEWLQPHPHPDPFSKPILHDHDRQIQITDDNTNAPGIWNYMLRATINNKHYSTETTLGVGAKAANPNIKNN